MQPSGVASANILRKTGTSNERMRRRMDMLFCILYVCTIMMNKDWIIDGWDGKEMRRSFVPRDALK